MKNKMKVMTFLLLFTIFTSIVSCSTKDTVAPTENNQIKIDMNNIYDVTVFKMGSNLDYDKNNSTVEKFITTLQDCLNTYSNEIYLVDGVVELEKNLAKNLSRNDPNNYYVEIKFVENITIKNEDMNLEMKNLIIDIDKLMFYCWNDDSDNASEFICDSPKYSDYLKKLIHVGNNIEGRHK